jgi:signal peptidase I
MIRATNIYMREIVSPTLCGKLQKKQFRFIITYMLKSFLRNAWEIAKIVIISLAIIVPLRYFVVQPFFVKGASMEPNFEDGEYLVVDEISYRFKEPVRGDVIVFKYPKDPSQYYIKRIIGLPEEDIRISNQNVFVIDGDNLTEIEEDYLPEKVFLGNNGDIHLGENEYFVMGDNRRMSYDSRQWGSLDKNNIIGKVWIRIWPFDKFKIFNRE